MGNMATNLAAAWSGPFGGVPPFDKADVSAFKPQLEAAMAAQLAAVDRIAADPEPATFENTLAALERAERDFYQASVVYGTFGRNMSSPEYQAVEREMEPRLAGLYDRMVRNRHRHTSAPASQEFLGIADGI